MAFANSGMPVTLLDIDADAVDHSLAAIRGEYEGRVKRGRMTQDAAEERIALIEGSTDYGALSQSDVVIEAVFENMDLKKKIFSTLDEACKAKLLFPKTD